MRLPKQEGGGAEVARGDSMAEVDLQGIGRERGRLFILVALDSLLGADAAAEGARA